jgi:phosphoglycolate phosphatase-like HAD superfamily hydrolase
MILIGDARNDIIAAKSCDLDIIAIATGKHNFLELHELKPNLILENLLVDREVFRNYIRDYL